MEIKKVLFRLKEWLNVSWIDNFRKTFNLSEMKKKFDCSQLIILIDLNQEGDVSGGFVAYFGLC